MNQSFSYKTQNNYQELLIRDCMHTSQLSSEFKETSTSSSSAALKLCKSLLPYLLSTLRRADSRDTRSASQDLLQKRTVHGNQMEFGKAFGDETPFHSFLRCTK